MPHTVSKEKLRGRKCKVNALLRRAAKNTKKTKRSSTNGNVANERLLMVKEMIKMQILNHSLVY
jgi:hypothetical protein